MSKRCLVRHLVLIVLGLTTFSSSPPSVGESAVTIADERSVSVFFNRLQLTDEFWSEGVAIGDVNNDGHKDIVAGPYWYEGPEFRVRHEIFPATETFEVRKEDGTVANIRGYEGGLGTKNAYSNVQFMFLWDFNGDGWLDVLAIDFPGKQAVWYENPGSNVGHSGPWQRHLAFESVGDEAASLVDLFQNGHPVIICTSGDVMGYVAPGPNSRRRWHFHAISDSLAGLREPRKFLHLKEFPYAHGLGYGDINGDGRLDVLGPDGWWEQPQSAMRVRSWKFHKWSFLLKRPKVSRTTLAGPISRDNAPQIRKFYQYYRWPYSLSGAQIYAYDVNGDGLADVVSSLDAHGYGLAWFEQIARKDVKGDIQFVPHTIMEGAAGQTANGKVSFSQLHALGMTDIDGDGVSDIVTGKRFWAHGSDGFSIFHLPDPESESPAVLYWFRLARGHDKTVEFIPYLIDSDSGVGTQIAIADINGDGLTDIAVANKKGVFVFLRR